MKKILPKNEKIDINDENAENEFNDEDDDKKNEADDEGDDENDDERVVNIY